jgi:hypothetical protein
MNNLHKHPTLLPFNFHFEAKTKKFTSSNEITIPTYHYYHVYFLTFYLLSKNINRPVFYKMQFVLDYEVLQT